MVVSAQEEISVDLEAQAAMATTVRVAMAVVVRATKAAVSVVKVMAAVAVVEVGARQVTAPGMLAVKVAADRATTTMAEVVVLAAVKNCSSAQSQRDR